MKFEIFDIKKYIENDSDKKIILYGQGDMAYITSLYLMKNGVMDFLFANYMGIHMIGFDTCISRLKLFEIYNEKEYIILWSENLYSMSEAKLFEENGIYTVFSVRKLWEESRDYDISGYGNLYHNLVDNRDDYFFVEDVIENPDKIYLYSLDAVVTERCSMKCRDCSNLMQYYCNPVNLDVDEIASNIKLLLDKVDRIHDLRILGGEPFMNMDFVNLIEKFNDNGKIDKISIYSNATIFPGENRKEVLEYLKAGKVDMRFSDYGGLSRELSHWVEWCEENGVRYTVNRIDVWQDLGKLERHDYSTAELMDMYGNCECRNTPTIIGSKLFNCPYAAHAYNLGAVRKEEAYRDYLELSDSVTGSRIDGFLYERPYLEACRYCGGRNIKRASIKPYVQTKKPLEYAKLYDGTDIYDNKSDKVTAEKKLQDKMVSIVIPFYNSEKTLERCLQSIACQTYKNLEIVLVDDGSDDESISICERFIRQNRSYKFKLIQNAHAGVLFARCTGVREATGEYLMFVDSDDYVEKEWVEKLVDGIQDADYCIARWWNIYGDYRLRDVLFDRGQGTRELYDKYPDVGLYVGKEHYGILLDNITLRHTLVYNVLWNKIYITSYMQEVCGKINENIYIGEDIVMVLGYVLKCNRLRVIDYAGYTYNVNTIHQSGDKYGLEKCIYDIKPAWDILNEIYNGGKLDILGQESLMAFIDAIWHKTWEKFGFLRYYYPYYGRLDSKKVVLYGAGNVGKSYYQSIIWESNVELAAWIDKNAEKLKNEQMLPVVGVDMLAGLDYDYIIIAIASEAVYLKICEELAELGVPKSKILWNRTKLLTILWG